MNTIKVKKEAKNRFWVALLWLVAFSFMALPEAKADKDIDFDGEWDESYRSISQNHPVTASLNEAYLFIETTSTRSDITIRIVKDATVVYEEILYQPKTATTISLEHFDKGLYRLELTNQWGDFLYGEFEKL